MDLQLASAPHMLLASRVFKWFSDTTHQNHGGSPRAGICKWSSRSRMRCLYGCTQPSNTARGWPALVHRDAPRRQCLGCGSWQWAQSPASVLPQHARLSLGVKAAG